MSVSWCVHVCVFVCACVRLCVCMCVRVAQGKHAPFHLTALCSMMLLDKNAVAQTKLEFAFNNAASPPPCRLLGD